MAIGVQHDETVISLCAKLAHTMSASDEPRRVHFQSPDYLVERLDAIADLFDKDRTDLLVEAIREYIEETANSDTFQELVAAKYYDGQLEFETVKQLVGAETAQRLRLLKADLEGEPLDLAAPENVDIYGGDATTVSTDDTEE
jgi:predicted DNA-binding protein